MSNFLRQMPVYQPSGTPAFAWVKVLNVPPVGTTITINGDVYTFGTDFFGNSAAQVLRSLVSAVRADQNEANEVAPTNVNFFRAYYSQFSGSYCVLFAVVPGPGGNALTLATSNPSVITISGGTFTGGATGSSADSSGPLTDASGTIAAGGTAQSALAANPSRKYLFISNLDADILWVNFGAVAAVSTPGSIPVLQNGALVYETGFIPTGAISVVGATTGNKYTLKWA